MYYIFNPFIWFLVLELYLEHPESDLDDPGAVAIVGKRATFPWPVCECFYFIDCIFIMLSEIGCFI